MTRSRNATPSSTNSSAGSSPEYGAGSARSRLSHLRCAESRIDMARQHLPRLALADLIGPDPKKLQTCRPEGRTDSNIGGVAPAGNQQAADPPRVIAGIKRM